MRKLILVSVMLFLGVFTAQALETNKSERLEVETVSTLETSEVNLSIIDMKISPTDVYDTSNLSIYSTVASKELCLFWEWRWMWTPWGPTPVRYGVWLPCDTVIAPSE